MAIINATGGNFDGLISDPKPVLVDFWASWCGPCRMFAPVLDEISRAMPDTVILKVNVDEEIELAERYGIQSIPTLIVFKNGEVAVRKSGISGKNEVIAMLK